MRTAISQARPSRETLNGRTGEKNPELRNNNEPLTSCNRKDLTKGDNRKLSKRVAPDDTANDVHERALILAPEIQLTADSHPGLTSFY
jgi:hypothetical protein